MNKSGFVKHRSTTDHLVWLENVIYEAFRNKQNIVSVFFLSRKRSWRHGIKEDLKNIGLHGCVPNLMSNFIFNRIALSSLKFHIVKCVNPRTESSP